MRALSARGALYDRKPQSHSAVPTGRRGRRARICAADAGAGRRPRAAPGFAAGARSLRGAGARTIEARRRRGCFEKHAGPSLAVVRSGRRRRGAEARSRRRARPCGCRRARRLRPHHPAGDGGDVPACEPANGAKGKRAMSGNPFALWVYLSQTPLLWLTVTLLVYAITDAVSQATRRHPLANPVLHAMWIIAAFLLLTGTSYTTYFSGA